MQENLAIMSKNNQILWKLCYVLAAIVRYKDYILDPYAVAIRDIDAGFGRNHRACGDGLIINR